MHKYYNYSESNCSRLVRDIKKNHFQAL